MLQDLMTNTNLNLSSTTTMNPESQSDHLDMGSGTNAVAAGNPSPRICTTWTRQDIEDHLEKNLECPICYEIILPPMISCLEGHSCCQTCRASVNKCPVCRGNFSNARNLFAEQLLEKCQFKCKYRCSTLLPAKELAVHYQVCKFRPVYCRECDELVSYSEFLNHLETRDKLERQKASECSTGFEIDEDCLPTGSSMPGQRVTIWEPTWMNCYGYNFFCSLDYNGDVWWIWVSSLEDEGCKYKSQILLWSKELESEHTYFGTIHSVRSESEAVLNSGNCLILTNEALKNFIVQGGIDILVRIENIYLAPRTRRGMEVQSPLEIMDPNRPRRHSNPKLPVQSPSQAQQISPTTPTRAPRSSVLRLPEQTNNSSSRIPVSTSSPGPNESRFPGQSARTQGNHQRHRQTNITPTGRRIVFQNSQRQSRQLPHSSTNRRVRMASRSDERIQLVDLTSEVD